VKHLLVLVLTLLSIGCGIRNPYVEKNARFLVTNDLQYDEVEVQIDDHNTTTLFKKSVFARLSENFEVKISIPKPANDDYSDRYPTGPSTSSNDWTTKVSVRFRIVRTGDVTSWHSCTAGAKYTTRVYIKPLTSTQVLTGCDNP
jgi:hypothetical protein